VGGIDSRDPLLPDRRRAVLLFGIETVLVITGRLSVAVGNKSNPSNLPHFLPAKAPAQGLAADARARPKVPVCAPNNKRHSIFPTIFEWENRIGKPGPILFPTAASSANPGFVRSHGKCASTGSRDVD